MATHDTIGTAGIASGMDVLEEGDLGAPEGGDDEWERMDGVAATAVGNHPLVPRAHALVPPPPGDDVVRRLESRLVCMCDRIWEKVAVIEEHMAKLADEVAIAKAASARPPLGDGAVAGARSAKELSELVESLVASQANLDRRFPEELGEVRQVLAREVQGLGENLEAVGGRINELESMANEQREAALAQVTNVESACQARVERSVRGCDEALTQLRTDLENRIAEFPQALERVRGEQTAVTRRVEQCELVTQRVEQCELKLREEREHGRGLDEAQRSTQAGLQRLSDRHDALRLAHDALQDNSKTLERESRAFRQELGALRQEVAASAEELPGLVLRRVEARCEADAHQAQGALRTAEQRLGEALSKVCTRVEVALPKLEARALEQDAALHAALRRMDMGFDAAETRSDERFKGLAVEVAERIEQERAQQVAACGAIDQRIQEAEPRICGLERTVLGADQQRVLYDQHLALQEQRLTLQEDRIQRLMEQCSTIPQALEARLEAARAAAKEDIAASSIAAFQGEMRLWAKMAQLGGSGGASPTAFDAAPPIPQPQSMGQFLGRLPATFG